MEKELTLEEIKKQIFNEERSEITTWKELKEELEKIKDSKNKTLMTDLYELTMSDCYFNEDRKEEIGYFDVFFRKNIKDGGYTIVAGLDEVINYIRNFRFTESDIEYLRSTNKFNDDFLEYLKDLRFTGDIYAVPDGTPMFPNEPVMTVRAPIIEAQLIETALLTCYNTGSLVATCAKRFTNEALNIPVMEFGARRVRGGIEGAIESSKYAIIGGCSSTSNTLAGKKYNIPVAGTQAHSAIQEANSEYEAFLNYAKRTKNKNECVFLVDTYDTLKSGIPNAIRVAKEYLEPNGYRLKGIRIDSGDLIYLTKVAREMLDSASMHDTKIVVSNGLDEYEVRNLLQKGAKIDSIGVGDNIVAAKERGNFVYKLVAIEKNKELIPKIKVSGDTVKTTNPGWKKVVRFYDNDTSLVLGDAIMKKDETVPKDSYTLVSDKDPWKKTTISDYHAKELQKPIFINGKLVYKNPSIKETKEYCQKEFETLTPRITDIENPHTYYVDLSIELRRLKEYMLYDAIEKAAHVAKEFEDNKKEFVKGKNDDRKKRNL